MKSKLKFLILSIAAGWCIGLGGLFNLSLNNKYCGAAAFAIGIALVMIYGMKLYTGFVPKISSEAGVKENLLNIPLCLLGNFIGTEILAISLQTLKYQNIIQKATDIVNSKTNLVAGLLCGIGCGIIIGLIVLNKHPILKWVLVVPLIMAFILTGMEHCVADAFYMGLANNWNILFLISVIVGNTFGGYLVGKIL